MRITPMQPIRSKQAVIVGKELSYLIVGAFYDVSNKRGYGFLESLDAKGLENALKRRNLLVQREHPLPVFLDGEEMDVGRPCHVPPV